MRERDLILVDYDNPVKNVYEITEKSTFHNGHIGTREDVVFLINGIPVLVIECKNANKDEAIMSSELLWQTLIIHRDVARQTYVRPLKDDIERLGKIVIGNKFEVELSDDWAIQSRTLNGITVPFESLSCRSEPW